MVSWCQRQVPPPAGGSCPRSRPGQGGTIPQQVQHPVRRTANPPPPRTVAAHAARHGPLRGRPHSRVPTREPAHAGPQCRCSRPLPAAAVVPDGPLRLPEVAQHKTRTTLEGHVTTGRRQCCTCASGCHSTVASADKGNTYRSSDHSARKADAWTGDISHTGGLELRASPLREGRVHFSSGPHHPRREPGGPETTPLLLQHTHISCPVSGRQWVRTVRQRHSGRRRAEL